MTNKVNCVNILYQFIAEMLTFLCSNKRKKEAENTFLKPLSMTRAYSRFFI